MMQCLQRRQAAAVERGKNENTRPGRDHQSGPWGEKIDGEEALGGGGWTREPDNHGKVNAGRRTTKSFPCEPSIQRTVDALCRIVYRSSQLSSQSKKKATRQLSLSSPQPTMWLAMGFSSPSTIVLMKAPRGYCVSVRCRPRCDECLQHLPEPGLPGQPTPTC